MPVPIPPKRAPVKDAAAAQGFKVPQASARSAAAIALEKEREAASAQKKRLADIAIVYKVCLPFTPFASLVNEMCMMLCGAT